jgi:hypothetical protein
MMTPYTYKTKELPKEGSPFANSKFFINLRYLKA